MHEYFVLFSDVLYFILNYEDICESAKCLNLSGRPADLDVILKHLYEISQFVIHPMVARAIFL